MYLVWRERGGGRKWMYLSLEDGKQILLRIGSVGAKWLASLFLPKLNLWRNALELAQQIPNPATLVSLSAAIGF